MPNINIPDISEFQGNVDWNNLDADIAIVRLCYGDLAVDKHADVNIEGARKRCVARGWYCYLVAGRDPVAQANTFIRILLAHGGLKPNEFVVVDDEESNGANEVARTNAFLQRCDAALGETDAQDWWYSGLNFSIAHNMQAAKGHRWIAAYSSREPTASHDLWQFTSSATLRGITGKVDMSVYHGTVNDFIKLIGGTSTQTLMDSSSTGGTMVILRSPWPTNPGRLDIVAVDGNGHCVHTWSDGGAGGLDNIQKWEDWGLLPNNEPIVPGTLSATWDNLSRICVVAADKFGNAYFKVIRGSDGGYDQDWSQINAWVSVPGVGQPGPAGPSYDDTDVRNRLSILEAIRDKLKAAIS